METSFVDALEKRAKTMLPPATVMRIECAGDATGDPKLAALLEEIEQKGVRGEALCDRPYEVMRFSDRVLLLCGGCERAHTLPRFAGIGRGETAEEAEENALYALTLSPDHPNAHRDGCLAAMAYGEGSFESVRYACAFNRAAYLHGVP